MILRLENIGYSYKSDTHVTKALDDISCEFAAGRMYAIMGQSGAGKTTLISIIARLDIPASGRIFFDGNDVTQINPDEYRSQMVSIVFQNYNLLHMHTAVENVSMVLHLRGYKENYVKHAEELLDAVSLPRGIINRPSHQLSGGEQQRIAIARALASGASVILADEPTGNLDKLNTENVMSVLMMSAKKYNKCVIIVTHSDDIASYADHVLTLSKGRLVSHGY